MSTKRSPGHGRKADRDGPRTAGGLRSNVVVSAFLFGRRLAWLPPALKAKAIIPVVSSATVNELARVLAYPKFRRTEAQQQSIRNRYLANAEFVSAPDASPDLPVVCRDRADVIVIALAVAAKADYLVTGDGHLAELRKIAPIPIISATELRDRV